MGEWNTEWRDECSFIFKTMAILSLSLCNPSACSRELLNPESSDCDLVGVILELRRNTLSDWLHISCKKKLNEKWKGKKSFQTFFEGFATGQGFRFEASSWRGKMSPYQRICTLHNVYWARKIKYPQILAPRKPYYKWVSLTVPRSNRSWHLLRQSGEFVKLTSAFSAAVRCSVLAVS